MSADAILSVCSSGSTPLWPQFPPLSPPTIDSSLASNDLEQQLRILVTEHRRVCLQFGFFYPRHSKNGGGALSVTPVCASVRESVRYQNLKSDQ